MTKIEMAELLVSCPAWDGLKDARTLARISTKDELQDAIDYMDIALDEYYS